MSCSMIFWWSYHHLIGLLIHYLLILIIQTISQETKAFSMTLFRVNKPEKNLTKKGQRTWKMTWISCGFAWRVSYHRNGSDDTRKTNFISEKIDWKVDTRDQVGITVRNILEEFYKILTSKTNLFLARKFKIFPRHQIS